MSSCVTISRTKPRTIGAPCWTLSNRCSICLLQISIIYSIHGWLCKCCTGLVICLFTLWGCGRRILFLTGCWFFSIWSGGYWIFGRCRWWGWRGSRRKRRWQRFGGRWGWRRRRGCLYSRFLMDPYLNGTPATTDLFCRRWCHDLKNWSLCGPLILIIFNLILGLWRNIVFWLFCCQFHLFSCCLFCRRLRCKYFFFFFFLLFFIIIFPILFFSSGWTSVPSDRTP